MKINELIKQKRLEKGYTMKELAIKCKVSEATISRWESGNIANMRRTTISSLAKELDIPIEALLGFSEAEIEHRTRKNDEVNEFWDNLSTKDKEKAVEILKAVFGGRD